MARYTGPVTRISRALGVMLFTNGNSKTKAYQKKNYKPGEHGQKFFSKMSEHKRQLMEKQKARFMYGISEKQSRRYFGMAVKMDGITGENFLGLLELRLDNVLFRAGFAPTRPAARQIVSHGLLTLNGKRVKTPSILAKVGDKLEIRENRKGSKLFEGTKEAKAKTPKWINSDLKNLKAEIMGLPGKDDLEHIIEHQLITEFYSK